LSRVFYLSNSLTLNIFYEKGAHPGLIFFISCKSTKLIDRFTKSAGSGMAEINRSTLGFTNHLKIEEYKKAGRLTKLTGQTRIPYFPLL
jgi:hypothetical protein